MQAGPQGRQSRQDKYGKQAGRQGTQAGKSDRADREGRTGKEGKAGSAGRAETPHDFLEDPQELQEARQGSQIRIWIARGFENLILERISIPKIWAWSAPGLTDLSVDPARIRKLMSGARKGSKI